MTLQNRKTMFILKNCFGTIFSPMLTPPIITGTKLIKVLQQDPVWGETKCQMPNSHCTSWVPLQWQATNSWAGLLPSLGVNGYHRVILFPGNPFYLEQVAARCLFAPLILSTLAPTICLLARREGQLAQRMCCEFTVIHLLFEQF